MEGLTWACVRHVYEPVFWLLDTVIPAKFVLASAPTLVRSTTTAAAAALSSFILGGERWKVKERRLAGDGKMLDALFPPAVYPTGLYIPYLKVIWVMVRMASRRPRDHIRTCVQWWEHPRY